MSVVEISGLRVMYDEVTAVSDLSFQMESGKIYGFVGPNGAGKTSTIKALAGVVEPTQGSIIIDGHNLETAREKALRYLGYMPDFSPVYENLKVWEYLDVFLAAYGVEFEARPEKVEIWLHKADLFTKKDALIKGLSRGMRQRLVLAKTLSVGPKVLLLDEPASGLDPIARKQMRNLLKEASANGVAILISSHILSELSEFVDSVIILEKGRLVMAGTIDEARQRVGSSQRLVVRFIRDEEGVLVLQRLLAELNIAPERVAREKAQHIITFLGPEGEASVFLQKLVAAGVGIAECSIQNDNIEDIFLKIGAKEVA